MTAATLTTSPALTTLVSKFAPIDLDELNSTAALQNRAERKYILTESQTINLVDWMTQTTNSPVQPRVLQVAERLWNSYQSTYFDTAGLQCYRMALQQHRDRFKVRTRTYCDTGQCFLEVKTKTPQGHTLKRRISWDDLDPQAVWLPRGADFIGGCLPTHLVESSDFAPTLTTSYQRLTLHLPQEKSRMTIDTKLQWRTPNHADTYGTKRTVLEVKSAQRVTPVDRWLWRHGHRPVPSSKYAAGIALFHSDLPRGRWARTLSRDLDLPELSRGH